jgi:hypothetical protein
VRSAVFDCWIVGEVEGVSKVKAIHMHRLRVPLVAGAMLASAVICSTAGSANAQQTVPNAYTDLSQYLVVGSEVVPRQALTAATPTPGALSSSVTQIGQGNAASVTLNGTGNLTTQYQNGSNNSSTLSVNGTQNAVTTTQIGSSNTTSIGVAGNGNSISNLQVGSGLSYQLEVIGKSVPVSVQQYGRK